MSAPKVGDRVRVVLEGEATGSDEHGFWIGRAWDTNHINPDAEHVVSVEILRPPVKVGDVIETAEQLDALPVFAVIRDAHAGVTEKRHEGWQWIGVRTITNGAVTPVTVLYLPDGAA